MSDFDWIAVLDGEDGVLAKLTAQEAEIHARAAREKSEAYEAAGTYGRHLANGGDPTDHPGKNGSEYGNRLVSFFLGLNLVYRAWNTARGGTNPATPIKNEYKWRVGEYLHERVGQPVPFADLKTVYGGRHVSADTIAEAVSEAQTADLIARKTKANGKVAYVLRPKREGEEPARGSWQFPEETK